MWDAISSSMHKHYKLQSHGPDVISDTEAQTGFDNESDYLVQGLLPSNSSGLDDGAELKGNMVELLRRSILYIAPVDPVYWCGALRKCEGRILPCLRVS